jgi:RNA polymerase sigma-70 factor (ECF subfamily)
MTEVEIIQSIKSGNTEAFKTLVEKYQTMVFRTAMGFVHSKEDAEDLTQEIFVKGFQSIGNFMEKAEFSTWLYRITVNMSLNYVNRKKIERFFDLTNEKTQSLFEKQDEAVNPEQRMINNERDQLIRKAIDRLSEKQRTAFVLNKYENLSQREIAAIMQISEGAVEQHLQRAKVNLQKKLSSLVGK